MNATAQKTEIALIEAKDLVTFDREKVDDFLKKLREQEMSVIGDISTERGRKDIVSRAYRIARIKTEVDSKGAAVKEDAAKIVKAVDEERRRIKGELEALQHEVRAPLTEWENAHKARIAAHEAAIVRISDLATMNGNEDADTLNRRRADALTIFEDSAWEEFANRAKLAFKTTHDALSEAHARRVKHDAEQAELAELRRKQAEEEQKDRDTRIAAEAAAKAKDDAEAKAADDAKAETDRQAAILAEEKERAEKAEADLAAAKTALIAAEKKAADDKIAAEAEAKRREEAAAQSERDLQAAALKAEQDAQAKREANKAHKAKIHNEIKDALQAVVDGGVNGADPMKDMIIAIAQGKIPHVKISY